MATSALPERAVVLVGSTRVEPTNGALPPVPVLVEPVVPVDIEPVVASVLVVLPLAPLPPSPPAVLSPQATRAKHAAGTPTIEVKQARRSVIAHTSTWRLHASARC